MGQKWDPWTQWLIRPTKQWPPPPPPEEMEAHQRKVRELAARRERPWIKRLFEWVVEELRRQGECWLLVGGWLDHKLGSIAHFIERIVPKDWPWRR